MKRFLCSTTFFRQFLRNSTLASKSGKVRTYNLENQNHLSKLFSEINMNKNRPEKNINKEEFLKHYPQAQQLINICSSYGVNEFSIMNVIQKAPEVLNFNMNNVSSVLSELELNGFKTPSIAVIIMEYPHILQYEPKYISKTFDVWRKGHFGEIFIKKLFISYPLLFALNDDNVKERLSRINYLMGNKINRTTNLLLRNPSILVSNWEDVEEKFDYVFKTMRYLEKEISRSNALSVSLQFIILRHTFLDKCGVYIRPSMKDDKGFDPHENPPLSKILEFDDDKFAKHVAKVSPEEYEVYKTLMHYEETNNPDFTVVSDFDLK